MSSWKFLIFLLGLVSQLTSAYDQLSFRTAPSTSGSYIPGLYDYNSHYYQSYPGYISPESAAPYNYYQQGYYSRQGRDEGSKSCSSSLDKSHEGRNAVLETPGFDAKHVDQQIIPGTFLPSYSPKPDDYAVKSTSQLFTPNRNQDGSDKTLLINNPFHSYSHGNLNNNQFTPFKASQPFGIYPGQQLRTIDTKHPVPVLPGKMDSSKQWDKPNSMAQASQTRQYPVHGQPQQAAVTELTYDPREMKRVYGDNFQPPIFTISRRQPHAIQVQSAVPTLDSRYWQVQRRLQHPLPVLRATEQSTEHMNDPLPPNVYGAVQWQPYTNLRVNNPLGLEDYEQTAIPIEGLDARSTKPLCREKRQIASAYPWNFQGFTPENQFYNPQYQTNQRSVQLPFVPSMSPFHLPSPSLNPTDIFPQPDNYGSYANALGFRPRDAMEGIQNVVNDVAYLLPMFAGNGIPHK